MLSFEKNNFYFFIILVMFFGTQITDGTLQILFLGLMLVSVFLFVMTDVGNLWTIIFFAVLFQFPLQRVSAGSINQAITYFDEVVEVFICVFLLSSALKRGILLNKNEKRIIVFYLAYLFLCIISSVGTSFASVLTKILDCFVCIKFMIYYRGGTELSRSNLFSTETLYHKLNTPCKYTACFLLFLTLHDLFFPAFFEKSDYRYFTESIELCFLHPTYLAAACLTCMVVLMCCMQYDKKNIWYIIMLGIVTILTFRSKAIAAVMIIFAIYFAYVKYKAQFKGLILISAACFGVYFALDQIEVYFTAGSSLPIRLKLLQDGVSIANTYFPLGAGFGSFGTTVAYDSGSALYSQLGYMSGYYLNQPVADGFWGGIFAESGWVGSIFFAICIIYMFLEALRKIQHNRYSGWCMLSIMIYAIIDSTAETAFFNPAVAFMFLVFGIASASASEDDNEANEIIDNNYIVADN